MIDKGPMGPSHSERRHPQFSCWRSTRPRIRVHIQQIEKRMTTANRVTIPAANTTALGLVNRLDFGIENPLPSRRFPGCGVGLLSPGSARIGFFFPQRPIYLGLSKEPLVFVFNYDGLRMSELEVKKLVVDVATLSKSAREATMRRLRRSYTTLDSQHPGKLAGPSEEMRSETAGHLARRSHSSS